MNIADYLSELLSQHDEVSLPGLGYFVRERVNGYYNDRLAKFYPPHHRVKFVEEPRDDDTFVQYVAEKKNISLASSKYFVEKFINKLKEDAAIGTYIFSDLGQFYTDHDRLSFNAYDKITPDPAFYGYEAVNIGRIGHPAFGTPIKTPVDETPIVNENTNIEEQQPEEEVYYEDDRPRRRISGWVIFLIILGVIAAAFAVAYKFYPDKVNSILHLVNHDDTVVTKVKHPKKGGVQSKKKPDTVVRMPYYTMDSAKKARWEIIVSQFKKLPYANEAVRRLKADGVAQAKVLTDVPGVFLKITAGTYTTFMEADSVRQALIKAKKINNKSYTELIPNQQ